MIEHTPNNYVEQAVVAGLVQEEMIARLDLLTLVPKIILDVGCGLNGGEALLQKRYPDARIINLDWQWTTLNHYQDLKLCADTLQLPLKDNSVDLLFANFMLPWQNDVNKILQEWRRVLRSEGLLMFTALGPDSLQPLSQYFSVQDYPQLMDMHVLGDTLLKLFADPVLDICHYQLSYRDKEKMLSELIGSEMWWPQRKEIYLDQIPTADLYEVNFEVIFAHAFGQQKRGQHSDPTISKFPIDQLRKKSVT